MQKKIIEGINVEIYTDATEFTNTFFEIVEGIELDLTNLPLCAGFACPETNEIFIYVNNNCNFDELFGCVAHELGHLQTKINYKDQEQKANHYEQFVIKSYNIAKVIYHEKN